jgi:carbonic anhydrase
MCRILQSPVNVNKQNLISDKDPIMFDYYAHDFSNNIENFSAKSSAKGMTVGGVEYHLSQFHFHTPSEHTIDGKSYPAVAHFVHHDKDGNLAVVGVMYKVGKPNKKFKEIVESENMGMKKKIAVESSDLTELLPVNREYFHYMGSLTTPPCTEGVSWFVMKHPVEISQKQLDDLNKLMPNNARPIQDPNGRVAQ